MEHSGDKKNVAPTIQSTASQIQGQELGRCCSQEKFLHHVPRLVRDGHYYVTNIVTVALRHAAVTFLKTRGKKKKTGKTHQSQPTFHLTPSTCSLLHRAAPAGDSVCAQEILRHMRESILHTNFLSPSKSTPDSTRRCPPNKSGLLQQRNWIQFQTPGTCILKARIRGRSRQLKST